MTIFEYFLILFSVILSLGLAHLATGVGELLRSRAAIRWSLPHVLWMVITFATIIDLWSSTWLTRSMVQWNLVAIVFALTTALATYLAAMWLIPRHVGDERIDLYEYMVRERRLFLGAFGYYLVGGILWNIYLLPAGQFDWANYYIAAPMLGVTALAWVSPNRIVQYAAPVVGIGLLIIYFSVYFPTIG